MYLRIAIPMNKMLTFPVKKKKVAKITLMLFRSMLLNTREKSLVKLQSFQMVQVQIKTAKRKVNF